MAKANSISLCLYILRTQGIAGTRTCSAHKALRRQPQASATPLPCCKTPRIREADAAFPVPPRPVPRAVDGTLPRRAERRCGDACVREQSEVIASRMLLGGGAIN